MVALKKLIMYLIPIIVFILIVQFNYWGEDSAFEKVKDAAKGTMDFVKDVLPEVSVGAKEISGKVPEIPEDHEEAITDLADTIKDMLESDEVNCFDEYEILPDLKEKGTVIELSDNNMVVKTLGGKQTLGDYSNELTEKVQGFHPCVIGGSEKIVKNFEYIFLNEYGLDEKIERMKSPHYNPVDLIIINYDLKGFNENRISYSAEKKLIDFEDYGFLYKPEHGVICFFPTVDGNNVCDGSNEKGLDDDCLGEDYKEDISIPKQYNIGNLRPC